MTKTAYLHLYDGRVEVQFDYNTEVSPPIKIGERDDIFDFISKLTIRDGVNVKMINNRGAFKVIANGRMDRRIMRRIRNNYLHTKA